MVATIESRLQAVGNKLIIKPKRPRETSAGKHGRRIFLPADSQLGLVWEQEFEVISIGPHAETDFEVGDRLLIKEYEGLAPDGVVLKDLKGAGQGGHGKRVFVFEDEPYVVIDMAGIVAKIRKGSPHTYTVDARGHW